MTTLTTSGAVYAVCVFERPHRRMGEGLFCVFTHNFTQNPGTPHAQNLLTLRSSKRRP